MYKELEKKFKVIYPENENATYKSLVNYSDDLDKPFQSWYRYKEGFSIELVRNLIEEYNKNSDGTILDPFMGSGSTLLSAEKLGLNGIGFEVNPFSFFLSEMKLYDYSEEEIKQFKICYKNVLEKSMTSDKEYKLPKLSTSEKVFNEDIRKYYMTIKKMFMSDNISEKVRKLMLLGWLACLENISNYRKAGNGLKIKKYKKPRIITKQDVYIQLLNQYENMHKDIKNKKSKNLKGCQQISLLNDEVALDCDNRETVNNIYNDSCLNMKKYVKENSVSGIIFSPPYANCFDYTEIYKLELWFGDFVSDYSDLKKLRTKSLHSHLNGNMSLDEIELKSNDLLDNILLQLDTKELWDKRIPNMIRLYFNDMYNLLDLCYDALEEEGFCSIIVGNSAYGGIIIPTDLLLADYAKQKGFTVDKIEVDRYIITSSQQYEITKENKRFLRESVICLRKESKKKLEDEDELIKVDNLPVSIQNGGTYVIQQSNPNTYTHNFFKYPCKFIPEIPRWAIKKYCKDKNSTILDPFLGSGTTLLESLVQGHNALGTDVDDVAKLITRAKTNIFSKDEIESIKTIFKELNDNISKKNISPIIPRIDNLEHWFPKENIDLLGKLRFLINEIEDIRFKEFFEVCFISIIKKSSFADDASPKPYVSTKIIKTPVNPISEFKNVFNKYIAGIVELSEIQPKNIIKILDGNALDIKLDGKVDLAITSPPYINAFDYGRTLRLENLWLGYLTEAELRDKKKIYVGTEKIKVKEEICNLDILADSKMLDSYYNELINIDEKRALIVKKFFEDMKLNMIQVKKHLKSQGHYCIVIGNSTIRKIEIESWKVLAEIAKSIGFEVDTYFNYVIQNPYINIPRKGRGGKISKDYIIVLKRNN